MSTLKVESVKIEQIHAHPNADRLEIAQIKGWQCIVQKDRYKAGDLAIYIPIDSVLPADVESKLFPPESKVKLSGGRVKTIKLRGIISQGMLADFKTLGFDNPEKEGTDLTKRLGITKYEPKGENRGFGNLKMASNRWTHPFFAKYTSIENLKNFNKMFQDGEEVVITEKVHGTNFRAGWVPKVPRTLWQKVLQKIGLFKGYEFVYGSHNVLLQNISIDKKENVYARIVNEYNLMHVIPFGYVVYGEIYGAGIQKGYTYGLKDTVGLVLFDVKYEDEFVDFENFLSFVDAADLPIVPILYEGPFSLEIAKAHVDGPSVMCLDQPVREGVIIKALKGPRKILKYISDDYLMKDNTDWH